MQISRIPQHNFYNNTLSAKDTVVSNPQQAVINFTGGIPKSNFFEPLKKLFKPATFVFGKLVDGITNVYSKLINTDFAKKVIDKSENSDVVKHISAAIGLIVSSTYISSTLKNKKMASDQKTTLAINQGIVAIVATTMGYTVSKALDKSVASFVRKYSAVNYNNPKMKTLKAGAGAAAAMVIFATMYRYISPVLVTPIANTLGNRIQANKKAAAKEAAEAQAKAQAPAATVAPAVATATPSVSK